jgi:hypothetical protein
MADTVFETRGHYLYSWTLPTPSGAKTIEQLSFLFSVALPMPLGSRSFMQHFWFNQKLASMDETALGAAVADKRDRFIAWAKGSGFLYRPHRMVKALVSVEEFIPSETSQATLSVSSQKGQPFTLVSLKVITREGTRFLGFKMDQLAATNAQDVPGYVYSASSRIRTNTSNIYVAGDPWAANLFVSSAARGRQAVSSKWLKTSSPRCLRA